MDSIEHLYVVPSIKLATSKRKTFGTLRLEPCSAGWEARLLPLCNADALATLALSHNVELTNLTYL